MIPMHSAGSITTPKFPKFNANVCIVNGYSYFFLGSTKYKWHIPRPWLNKFNGCLFDAIAMICIKKPIDK